MRQNILHSLSLSLTLSPQAILSITSFIPSLPLSVSLSFPISFPWAIMDIFALSLLWVDDIEKSTWFLWCLKPLSCSDEAEQTVYILLFSSADTEIPLLWRKITKKNGCVWIFCLCTHLLKRITIPHISPWHSTVYIINAFLQAE